ncbi:methyltransferase domain-containing protein [Lyticum sinuosum]|uniref:Alonyl-acyl carrier protein O-methyltransferase BioC domain protein n=1 Tax=Lyticum sinuosum TaxID=1332059 RepID=A0AAE4VKD4_9RICK|nr:methyltransferase domain-containing protein [Lyticum sinuosum]MDZ5760943.1 putative alonyl-acyl carrier protein O-methyltransferase BioC domain protein [Lyticum sinuosum]
MNNYKQIIESKFDYSSNYYDSVASVQKTVADTLVSKLLMVNPLTNEKKENFLLKYTKNIISKCVSKFSNQEFFNQKDIRKRVILDLGTGTGYVPETLSKSHPDAIYILNDISGKMLDICKKKFVNNIDNNFQFLHCDMFNLINQSVELLEKKEIINSSNKIYSNIINNKYSNSNTINTNSNSNTINTNSNSNTINTSQIIIDNNNQYPVNKITVDYCDVITSSLSFQWVENLYQIIENCHEISNNFAFATLLENTFMKWYNLIKEYDHNIILPNYPNVFDLIKFCFRISKFNLNQDKNHNNSRFYYWVMDFPVYFNDLQSFIEYLNKLSGCAVPNEKFYHKKSISYNNLKEFMKAEKNKPIKLYYKVFFGIFTKE